MANDHIIDRMVKTLTDVTHNRLDMRYGMIAALIELNKFMREEDTAMADRFADWLVGLLREYEGRFHDQS